FGPGRRAAGPPTSDLSNARSALRPGARRGVLGLATQSGGRSTELATPVDQTVYEPTEAGTRVAVETLGSVQRLACLDRVIAGDRERGVDCAIAHRDRAGRLE